MRRWLRDLWCSLTHPRCLWAERAPDGGIRIIESCHRCNWNVVRDVVY